jgi:ATP-dependent DNA helicase RecG
MPQPSPSCSRLCGFDPSFSWVVLSNAEKADRRSRLSNGSLRLVVGTHALVQESVSFQRLGLVVIDEQHRFGVEQRAALVAKGAAPDVLLLTATPIPRSLALTRFGDLDLSAIKTRPPGRGKVKTGVRTAKQRDQAFAFVREQCLAGRQAYVVLPVIEETERADLRAATTMAELLKEKWSDVTVGLVHGRLKPEERDLEMRRFRAGEIQVLVATTVIEVGIDVPNATVMLIEHPERFGLAQLHQLRGELVADLPRASAFSSPTARQHLGSRPSPRPKTGSRSPSLTCRSGRWGT